MGGGGGREVINSQCYIHNIVNTQQHTQMDYIDMKNECFSKIIPSQQCAYIGNCTQQFSTSIL